MTKTRCARCGRPVTPGAYLCDRCRDEEGTPVSGPGRPPTELEERSSRWPAWMSRPSPVQYHATIATVIVLVLVGLAVFAFFSNRGVGPFRATVERFEMEKATLIVDVTVENQGSKTARANCRVFPVYGKSFGEPTDIVLTAEIPPGETRSFVDRVPGVEAPPTAVKVTCT